MFDLVYLKFIHIFSFSLHRLVKSNHAETFHLKVFSLSPGGLKLESLLLPNVRLFLRGAATRDYSDITICNHPTAPQRPSLQLLSVRLLSKSLSWNHPLPLFPRMSPDRENCLLLFISNLIFVALSAATVVAQQAKEQL